MEAITADWFVTLADQTQTDEKQLKFEHDICSFVESNQTSKQPLSDKAIVSHHARLQQMQTDIFKSAGVSIKNKLDLAEYAKFKLYIRNSVVPDITFIKTNPSQLLRRYVEPLAKVY
ncbi:MAG: hypothetical protein HRT35_09215 [Algicola sp.]|nr:hypothetical protein [Algicola sp.]